MTKKPALNWETRTRTVEVEKAFDVAEIRMTEDEVAEIIQRHIRAMHMLPIQCELKISVFDTNRSDDLLLIEISRELI